MNDIRIAPSILSADFADIISGVRLIESSGADWIHLDVMDGQFVPNLTFGAKMIADIRKRTSLYLDAHLMTIQPENLIEGMAQAGADSITVHVEATVHLHRLIERIKSLGVKAGVSLVPSTPVAALLEILPCVDLVLVMSVNPGFGGQSLIPACLRKAADLVRIRETEGYGYLVSMDGGLNRDTLPDAIRAGIDVAVMGSAFFGAADPSLEVMAARDIKRKLSAH